MRRIGADLAHALAGEYVVGTLRGRARRRFEAIAREDRAVAEAIRAWEKAMTPLAEAAVPVEPPARVWREIEARIGARREPHGLWASLAFWRNLGMLATGLAVVLAVAFLGLSGGAREEPLFVAILTAPDATPRAVASLYAPDTLHVRIVKPWSDVEGKSLELWALSRAGAPRSLGLVANTDDRDTLIRLARGDPRLRDANALAVSVEPAGGSPTKLPTGPVICSGAVPSTRI